MVIKQTDASIIADLMLGGDGRNPSGDLGEIQLSAVQEAMNQMMGSAATSMSTVFSKKVDISPPSIDLMYIPKGEGEENIPDQDLLVKVSFSLKIGDLIDSNIMQLLPLHFAKSLVDELMNGGRQRKKRHQLSHQRQRRLRHPSSLFIKRCRHHKPRFQLHNILGARHEHRACQRTAGYIQQL